MLIPHETVSEIHDAARIEEVVGEYVSLKRRGANYIGLCPFHNEKTPSFIVSPAKGIFKCFGCGKAGDSVRFIMEHEHCSYPEALHQLADKYNIKIEERELSPEDLAEQNIREKMFNVNTFAQKYFTETMFNTEEGNAIGLKYFKERDLREATIQKFQLGYSLDAWDAFTKHALQNGYDKDILLKTGLSSGDDTKIYDRYRGRVIFPIHNLSGKVVGFGGRVLSGEKTHAKYVNSPESEIYNKSETLYGIHFARPAIARNDNCILVEGYFDVISMHQAGIENVVASSGTSLTVGQIRLIKRFTKNITMLYDGDLAGIHAAVRGTDMVLEEGMNVRVVTLPPEDDPDSFVRTHTTDEVMDFINRNSVDFVSFKANLLLKQANDDPIKIADATNEILKTISIIPDVIFRDRYIKKCSEILGTDERVLVAGLNKLLRKNFLEKTGYGVNLPETEIPQPKQQAPSNEGNNFDYQEKNIVKMLLTYGNNLIEVEDEDEDGKLISCKISVADYIISDLDNDGLSFINPVNNRIFALYKKLLDEGRIVNDKDFTGNEDSEIASLSADLLMTNYKLDNWIRHKIYVIEEKDIIKTLVESSLLFYKDKILINVMIPEIMTKLKDETNPQVQNELLAQKKDFDETRRKINEKLGIAITR